MPLDSSSPFTAETPYPTSTEEERNNNNEGDQEAFSFLHERARPPPSALPLRSQQLPSQLLQEQQQQQLGNSSSSNATPLVAATPPRHAFHIRNRTLTVEASEMPGLQEDPEYEGHNTNSSVGGNSRRRNQPYDRENLSTWWGHYLSTTFHSVRHHGWRTIWIQVWGRPYATESTFYEALPVAILLGAATGLAALIWIMLSQWSVWWMKEFPPPPSNTTFSRSPLVHNNSTAVGWNHTALSIPVWWWLLTTVLGAMASAVIVGCFSSAAVVITWTSHAWMDHVRTWSLAGSHGTRNDGVAVLASTLVLLTGAPVGPEQAVVSLGLFLARALFPWFGHDHVGDADDPGFVPPQRSEAVWTMTSMAASLGIFLPRPWMTAPVLLQEVAHVMQQPLAFSTGGRRLVEPSGNHGDDVLAADVSQPLLPSSTMSRAHLSPVSVPCQLHDHGEVVLVQVLAALASASAIGWFVPSLQELWHHNPNYAITLGGLQGDTDQLSMARVALAVPLGLLCGTMGSIFSVLHLAFASLQRRATWRLQQMGAPRWIPPLLLSALAGLIHGLLTMSSPIVGGSGLLFLLAALATPHQFQGLLTRPELTWAILAKLTGTAASLGLGLVGGPLIPMAQIGLFLALALSQSFSWLPLTLSMPCCVAACVVSVCPIPLTMVMVVSFMGTTPSSSTESGASLLACLVAWTITGGVGMLRRWGQQFLGETQIESQTAAVEPTDPAPSISDEELLQQVRSTIFGSP